jgi:hypothetical protein
MIITQYSYDKQQPVADVFIAAAVVVVVVIFVFVRKLV